MFSLEHTLTGLCFDWDNPWEQTYSKDSMVENPLLYTTIICLNVQIYSWKKGFKLKFIVQWYIKSKRSQTFLQGFLIIRSCLCSTVCLQSFIHFIDSSYFGTNGMSKSTSWHKPVCDHLYHSQKQHKKFNHKYFPHHMPYSSHCLSKIHSLDECLLKWSSILRGSSSLWPKC